MRFLDIAGHAPEDAGFPEKAPAVWSADSHDTVLIAGEVAWFPSQLLGALAEGPREACSPDGRHGTGGPRLRARLLGGRERAGHGVSGLALQRVR